MIVYTVGTKELQRYSNHPVHIVDSEGNISPSSFIPFCELGGNISVMGVNIAHFDFPVCNSFKRRILNNQLCYQVDINSYIETNQMNVEDVLKSGFIFLMDYNEDRISESGIERAESSGNEKERSLQSKFVHIEDKCTSKECFKGMLHGLVKLFHTNWEKFEFKNSNSSMEINGNPIFKKEILRRSLMKLNP